MRSDCECRRDPGAVRSHQREVGWSADERWQAGEVYAAWGYQKDLKAAA